MIKQYENEIKELKEKMILAEKFAKVVPIFSENILDNKLSGNEQWHKFGDFYKKVYFPWGVNRGLYKSGTNRNVTNYDGGEYNEYLFNVYINTLSMYDSHNKHDLEKICDSVDVFFYDKCNSTFYVTDENIESLLDELCEWYEKAREKQAELNNKNEIIKLQQKLDKLKND